MHNMWRDDVRFLSHEYIKNSNSSCSVVCMWGTVFFMFNFQFNQKKNYLKSFTPLNRWKPSKFLSLSVIFWVFKSSSSQSGQFWRRENFTPLRLISIFASVSFEIFYSRHQIYIFLAFFIATRTTLKNLNILIIS